MDDRDRTKKELIAELKLRNDLLKAISEAQDSYISGADIRPLFQTLLENAISLTDSQYGFIGEVLYKPDGAPFLKTYAVTNIAWNDATRKYYEEYNSGGMEFHNLGTLFGTVLTSGMPVISNDPANDPRGGGLPDGHPAMDAFLGIPISHGGAVCGMVGIANRVGGYTKEIIEFLNPFLTTCGTLIEARRVAEAEKRAEDKLRTSERQMNESQQALLHSEGRYRGLFENSPISMWEEDFTGLREYFDILRSSGITDLRAHYDLHPEELFKCIGLIRIIAVNKATLDLYEAQDPSSLLQDLSRVFTDESLDAFQGILTAIYEGAPNHECVSVNQNLTGRKINVLLRWSLLP